MSWKFPKRVPRQNHPLSPEDLAEGLRPFYEASGDINEHNIDSASFTTDLTVGVDTSSDLAYNIKEVNNYTYAALFDNTERDSYPVSAGWTEVNDANMEFSKIQIDIEPATHKNTDKCQAGDWATIHWSGSLKDGRMITDSRAEPGSQPKTFALGSNEVN